MDTAAFATELSPVRDVTASSSAAALVDQIGRIGGGGPCLVVAHSMGGVVATAAAELAPERVAGLVYVTAFAPVAGQSAGAYLAAPEGAGGLVHPLIVGDPSAIGAMRVDTGDADAHGMIREAFYHDVDIDTADAAIAMLSTDGPIGVQAEVLTVTTPRFGSIPHAYVLCTRDKAVPIALQRRFVREIDAVSTQPTVVTELDSSHSPFLSQPAALADMIASVECGVVQA